MKKKLILASSFFLLASSFSLFAAGGVWLPVHSYEKSASQLHVRESSTANLANGRWPEEKEWTFPASYTGHRSVCWLPGATSNMAFIAWVGGDRYAPGDPFGFTPAASSNNVQAIALTRTTAVTPRIKLWEAESSDRIARFGLSQPTNYGAVATVPTAPNTRVRVLCLSVDDEDAANLVDEDRIVFDGTFSRDVRDFIHEGDFLGSGFDIDWATFEQDIVGLRPYISGFAITNVAYAVVIGEGNASRVWTTATKEVHAHPVLVTRRFEATHTPPTTIGCDAASRMFRWRIDGEDKWASAYGTTYTAFRVRLYDATTNVVCDSGYQRMPAADMGSVYRWNAPASWTNSIPSATFWRVFTYNAKFKTDDVGSAATQFTP